MGRGQRVRRSLPLLLWSLVLLLVSQLALCSALVAGALVRSLVAGSLLRLHGRHSPASSRDKRSSSSREGLFWHEKKCSGEPAATGPGGGCSRATGRTASPLPKSLSCCSSLGVGNATEGATRHEPEARLRLKHVERHGARA